MPGAITWRDIAAPSANAANSLIRQSSRTFNDSFAPINNLTQLAREQALLRDQEQKQALANEQFGSIVNATDPNQLQDISFAGLGGEGANVASLLQGAKRQFSDIANTDAGTAGLNNKNDVFYDNNTIDQNLTKSQIRNNIITGNTGAINNSTLKQRNNLDIYGKQISNFNGYNNAMDNQLQQQANQPFYKQVAQNNATVSGNKATDSSTFTNQYDSQLTGARNLTGAQAYAARRNANSQRMNAVTQQNRLAYDKTKGGSGSKGSGGEDTTGEFAHLNPVNTTKALTIANAQPGISESKKTQIMYNYLLKGIKNPTKNQIIQTRQQATILAKGGNSKVKTPLNSPDSFNNLNDTEKKRSNNIFNNLNSKGGEVSYKGVGLSVDRMTPEDTTAISKGLSRHLQNYSASGGDNWYSLFNTSQSALLEEASVDNPALKKVLDKYSNQSSGASTPNTMSEQQARLQGKGGNRAPSPPRKKTKPKVLSAIVNQLKNNK